MCGQFQWPQGYQLQDDEMKSLQEQRLRSCVSRWRARAAELLKACLLLAAWEPGSILPDIKIVSEPRAISS